MNVRTFFSGSFDFLRSDMSVGLFAVVLLFLVVRECPVSAENSNLGLGELEGLLYTHVMVDSDEWDNAIIERKGNVK